MAYKKHYSKKRRGSRSYGKSVMKHDFAQIPNVNIERSKFNRSHGYKTTFDAGYLIPFFCDEILPGDTFNVKATALVRMATPIFPIMDNLRLDTQFFFVPNRLVWDNWQKFNGEQDDPGDSTDYVVPHAGVSSVNQGDLIDYFGIPLSLGTVVDVNILPFRAYQLIWNEWYRDQNLQDSVPFGKGDEILQSTFSEIFVLRKRGKRHDYFTSCLPWPQKGESVGIPVTLDTTMPVEVDNVSVGDVLTVENHAGESRILRTYSDEDPNNEQPFSIIDSSVYLGENASVLDDYGTIDHRSLHVHIFRDVGRI